MACPEVPIQTILGTECIGDSLPKIMGNFNTLGDATCDLITDVNALSSYALNLLSLIDALSTTTTTLSTNMQNIGNYPYAKFQESYTTALGDMATSWSLRTFNNTVNNDGFVTLNSGLFTFASTGTYEFRATVVAQPLNLTIQNITDYTSGQARLVEGWPTVSKVHADNTRLFSSSYINVIGQTEGYYQNGGHVDSLLMLVGQFNVTSTSTSFGVVDRASAANRISKGQQVVAGATDNIYSQIEFWKIS